MTREVAVLAVVSCPPNNSSVADCLMACKQKYTYSGSYGQKLVLQTCVAAGDLLITCMLMGSLFLLLLSMSCCRASLGFHSWSDSCTFFLMFSSILEWMKFLAFRPCRRGSRKGGNRGENIR